MMARNYRRRGSSSSEKFYRTLDNRLPVRFSFTTVTAAIIIVFITFVMACFTAAICGSSQEKSENSMEKASYCTAHYLSLIHILYVVDGMRLVRQIVK